MAQDSAGASALLSAFAKRRPAVTAHLIVRPCPCGRMDLLPEEIEEGKRLRLHEKRDRSGNAVYRIPIRNASFDRRVFRGLLRPLVRPGRGFWPLAVFCAEDPRDAGNAPHRRMQGRGSRSHARAATLRGARA
jgi:hypothetical protein